MGIRISEMEEATTFGADDYVPIVTNGTNKKALGQKIKDFIAGFFATKTGDNISDKATFRSAIEISATNTPFDKTGTGMSAENVQAGIVELSGNRALIDGSNIVDKATFRTNIGLPIQYIHTAVNASASVTAYVVRSDVFNLPTPSASANRYLLIGWNASASNNNDLIICKFSNGNITCTRSINQNDFIYIQGIIF